jgi:branched-chain amino acid transport system permease protein
MNARFAGSRDRLDLRLLLAVGGVALAAWAAFGASGYELRVLTLAGIYTILVLGYQLVFGHAGALSLAQGAFFGIGGYVTGILATRWGWPFPATFALSLAAPALLALLVALPVLRLQSHYFALATLAIAQTVLLVAVNRVDLTGGANGLYGVPGIAAFGVQVPAGLPLLAFVWACAGLAMAACWLATRGRRRTAYAMLRDAPLAAAASGLDLGRLRTQAFVLGAALAGAAGALHVHTLRVVSPEILAFDTMVLCLTMTVIGGRLRLAGAVLGALLLTHLPEWFRALEQYYLIATGAILLGAVLFAPNGLAALLPARRRTPPPVAPPAAPTARRVPPAALGIAGLTRAYGGVRAVDGIDVALGNGEIVGLIGANGSGKTTLANLVTGFAAPDAGTVAWNGAEIGGLPPHRIARAGIARSFQQPDLPAALTVAEAVAVALPPDAPDTAANALLAELGLADLAQTLCGSLPHGARRHADIARALAGDPGLLVLDEPAAGLTEAEAAALAAILRRRADGGLAILVIEHDTAFLAPLADRLVCLAAGRVIAAGPTAAVLAEPAVRDAWLGDAAAIPGADP